MLSWFHNFCVQNNLRYYALGGTLLGAVRHQGFIPWDDDVDVGMPRQDYLRLERLLGERMGERYVLETPNSENTDFFYPASKLYDTQTTLVENTRCRIRRGLYLDIFPLDGAGGSQEEAMRHFAYIRRRRYLLLALTTGIRNNRSLPKNMAVALCRGIPCWKALGKRLLHSIDRLSQSVSFEDCVWVGNMMGNWMERELMPRRVFGSPRKYQFEGLDIFGPEDSETYLSSLYGNWRELPPEEKRRSHHDYLLMDLQHGGWYRGEESK